MIRQEIDLLFQIQKQSPPCPIELPPYGPLYHIDLNSREIDTPKEVVVEKDHNAKTFYFTIDRFLDYMDLSTTNCVVLYTINDQTYVYPVPYYDVYTLSYQQKMIIPWTIDRVVTQEDGDIEFSFKFYKMSGDTSDNAEIIYSLNTKTATISVYNGLDAPEIEDGEDVNAELGLLYELIDQVNSLKTEHFTWTVIPEV